MGQPHFGLSADTKKPLQSKRETFAVMARRDTVASEKIRYLAKRDADAICTSLGADSVEYL